MVLIISKKVLEGMEILINLSRKINFLIDIYKYFLVYITYP